MATRSRRITGLELAAEQYGKLQDMLVASATPAEKNIITRRLVNLQAVMEYLTCEPGRGLNA